MNCDFDEKNKIHISFESETTKTTRTFEVCNNCNRKAKTGLIVCLGGLI